MHNDHHICVARHLIQHGGEVRQLHLKRIELLTDAGTGMFECLDEFGRSFVARRIQMVRILAFFFGGQRISVDW